MTDEAKVDVKLNVYQKLNKVQTELKAPKNQYNDFGRYHYRSCEDILEGLKPLLKEIGVIVLLSDSVEFIEGRYYVKARAQFVDTDTAEKIEVSAMAREEENKKGMDSSQITGSASSYARKYALNGLFAIDDTKDSDATNDGSQSNTQAQKSSNDYTINQNQLKRLYAIASKKGFNSETVKEHVKKRFGKEPKELNKTEYDRVVEGYEKKPDYM
ncbi:ERF family protein [Peptacetobacter sp.]|uniref:ERF family protein n=1 Tax=Peptacetobacter sp. TaxID=2991975 RepID=UPI002F40135F